MINVEYRGIKDTDMNFIYNSWLKSYRQSDFAKKVPNDVYYTYQKAKIDRVMDVSSILIIHAKDQPDHILGYIVASEEPYTCIHYVYVKYPYRKLGIAKQLCNSLVSGFGNRTVICTHAHYNWKEFTKKFNLVFNPYL